MQNFTNFNFKGNTQETQMEKISREQEILKKEKSEAFKKRFKIFIIIASIFLSLTLIVYILNKIPKNELITTDTFEIKSCHINSYYIYISYLDDTEENKILEDYITSGNAFDILYLSDDDKNYVAIEKYGHSGRIKKRKIAKLYITEETYETFKKEFSWEGQKNN